jgi:hypothetical protein
MRMILIYNVYMNKKIELSHKSNEYIKGYVKELTDDLDMMAEKMTKNELDVEAYQQWFGLICSALDLIKRKSKTIN